LLPASGIAACFWQLHHCILTAAEDVVLLSAVCIVLQALATLSDKISPGNLKEDTSGQQAITKLLIKCINLLFFATAGPGNIADKITSGNFTVA
jgi:hypothetical protein